MPSSVTQRAKAINTASVVLADPDHDIRHLLHAAGIEEAKMLVIAIDERESATELVRYVTENYPHVYIVARAVDRHHVYELYDAGARIVIRLPMIS